MLRVTGAVQKMFNGRVGLLVMVEILHELIALMYQKSRKSGSSVRNHFPLRINTSNPLMMNVVPNT